MGKLPFLYAQSCAKLRPGTIPPKIENSKTTEFDQWLKSIKDIAAQLAAAANK